MKKGKIMITSNPDRTGPPMPTEPFRFHAGSPPEAEPVPEPKVKPNELAVADGKDNDPRTPDERRAAVEAAAKAARGE